MAAKWQLGPLSFLIMGGIIPVLKGYGIVLALASVVLLIFYTTEGVGVGFLTFFTFSVLGLFQLKPPPLIWFFLLLVVSFFILRMEIFPPYQASMLNPENSDVTGVITSSPEENGNQISFTLRDIETSEEVRVQLVASNIEELEELQASQAGMMCSIEGEFEKPSPAVNFKGFDYQQFLERQGIFYQFYGEVNEHFSCVTEELGVTDHLLRFRQAGVQMIREHFPDESAGMAAALLFGDRQDLAPEIVDAYQETGIIHVLAVSGLHVGLIVAFKYQLLLRLGLTKERVMEVLIALLPAYIVVAGGAPSVIRASFMAMAVFLCLRFKMKLHPLDGVSIVGIVMLFIDPYMLYHIGFQLSFTITIALIITSPVVFRKTGGYFQRLILVSFIAQLAATPFLIYHFYQFSLLSLLLNLIFVPLISVVILPASFGFFFLSHLSLDFLSLMKPLNASLHYIHTALLTVHETNIGIVTLGRPSNIVLLLISISVLLSLVCFEKGRKAFFLSLIGVAVTLGIQYVAPYFDSSARVTMLDVGQGDSFLIELPYRQAVYLIDTGGSLPFEQEEWEERERPFDPGRDVVAPYLKAQGIRSLDKVIITHGHWDHYGGIFSLLEEVEVGKVLYGNVPIEEAGEELLFETLYNERVAVEPVKEGDHWTAAEQVFYVLSPVGDESSLNERSIVLFTMFAETSWLFTGDLEAEGEQRLVREYPGLKADVLKAGHHGSRTSSNPYFLEQLNPRLSLISAGRNNRFSHPHTEVLEEKVKRNIKILRTDQHGAVRFTYDKNGTQTIETSISPN
ncbi:DNA internalization-related competence protein ComEC/Rec2 [Salsuginibacillus kocurii]|uniref:DNA internalization-related competence protein ComEC/Rec2 n=1 Tax=Salsuginibacillus kocurii TaxID=427078 RepID=UPI0003A67A8A|nr:DNA internalization-related competence protein ComEC/Rec2 [Salsuginibacillus kocurii]